MGISLLDNVTLIPKSQEASIIKGVEVQKPVHEQVNLQQRMEQQVIKQGNQTIRTQETKNPEYRYDAREKGKNGQSQGQKKKKGNKSETAEEGLHKNQSQSGFDIRI